jgi:hypothetical protein
MGGLTYPGLTGVNVALADVTTQFNCRREKTFQSRSHTYSKYPKLLLHLSTFPLLHYNWVADRPVPAFIPVLSQRCVESPPPPNHPGPGTNRYGATSDCSRHGNLCTEYGSIAFHTKDTAPPFRRYSIYARRCTTSKPRRQAPNCISDTLF